MLLANFSGVLIVCINSCVYRTARTAVWKEFICPLTCEGVTLTAFMVGECAPLPSKTMTFKARDMIVEIESDTKAFTPCVFALRIRKKRCLLTKQKENHDPRHRRQDRTRPQPITSPPPKTPLRPLLYYNLLHSQLKNDTPPLVTSTSYTAAY